MRILFASLMFCYPQDNGNKKTDFDLIRHLVQKGHSIDYVFPSIADGDREAFKRAIGPGVSLFPSEIDTKTRIVSSIRARFWSSFDATINSYLNPGDMIRRALDCDVLIFDYWVTLRDFRPPGSQRRKPIVLKVNDIIAPRITARKKATLSIRAFLKRLYFKQEEKAYKKADVLSVFSLDEREVLSGLGYAALHVPVAVDTQVFKPDPNVEELENSVLFVASPNKANLEALRWMADIVAPFILEKLPDFKFHLLCKNASSEMLKFIDSSPFIVHHDWVEDLAKFYAEFPVVVLPFLSSTGVKIKLIEALACGKAIVSTSAGLTGTSAIPGTTAMAADDPKLFASHILDLFNSADRREELGNSARRFAERHHDLTSCFEPLDEWLESVSVDEGAGA